MMLVAFFGLLILAAEHPSIPTNATYGEVILWLKSQGTDLSQWQLDPNNDETKSFPSSLRRYPAAHSEAEVVVFAEPGWGCVLLHRDPNGKITPVEVYPLNTYAKSFYTFSINKRDYFAAFTTSPAGTGIHGSWALVHEITATGMEPVWHGPENMALHIDLSDYLACNITGFYENERGELRALADLRFDKNEIVETWLKVRQSRAISVDDPGEPVHNLIFYTEENAHEFANQPDPFWDWWCITEIEPVADKHPDFIESIKKYRCRTTTSKPSPTPKKPAP